MHWAFNVSGPDFWITSAPIADGVVSVVGAVFVVM